MPKIKFENGVVVNVEGNPTQADIEEIASQLGIQKAETPGGVSGAFKRGWQGLKEDLNKRVENTGQAMASDQSGVSKTLQVGGQGFATIGDAFGAAITTALSAITPDETEEKVKSKFSEGVQKIMGTKTAQNITKGYGKFKEEHPEAAGNVEAVANIADAFANALGVGAAAKGGKVSVKTAAEATGKAAEKVARGTAETAGSFTDQVANLGKKAAEKVGGVDVEEIGKTGASLFTGLEKSTVDLISKRPELFTPEAIKTMDRDVVFDRVKSAVDNRIKQLSETGKEYGLIRESGEKITLNENPAQKVLSKYGISIKKGKLVTSAESVPLGAGDIKAIEGFIRQYLPKKGKEMTSTAFLNARKALSNMSNYAEDKTDMAGTIARELRAELDRAGKEGLTGLKDLDARFAGEIKLLNQAKKAIYNRDGTVKSNAMSVIANLTGKGKEQLLPLIDKIAPGIEDQVRFLKAVEDIERTKGVKVGTYLRGATGGFVATGGNPIGALVGAIASHPNVAVPALRAFSTNKEGGTKSLKERLRKLGNQSAEKTAEDIAMAGEKVAGGKAQGKQVLPKAQEVKKVKTPEVETKSTEEPLVQEAKKYKSAEEFIKNYSKDKEIDIPDIQGINKNTIKRATEFDDGEDFYQKFGSSINEIKEKANLRYHDEIVKWWNNNIKPLKEKSMGGKPVYLDTTNPTGGIGDAFDYTPNIRAEQKIDVSKLTTLNETKGANADEIITIYRGAPKTQKSIVPGDFITDLPELAESYAGSKAHVLSKKVRLGDILDDIKDGGGNEYLYRPNADKEIAKTKSQLIDIWNKANKK